MTFEKLDIIIPQYNETEDMIRPLLSSIENQSGISKDLLTITIVNDHSEFKLSKEFLSSFSFPITYIETPENGGGGMARQYGIDHTSNPLIMFCDADDRFFDCMALFNLFNVLRVQATKGNTVNLLSSSFYEEFIDQDSKAYDLIKHDTPTMIWMHGKIFRRKFIEDNNIRFFPGLRTFEDTFFGKMVAMLAPQSTQIHCNYFTYFGVRNPKSITSNWNKDNKDYLFGKSDDYITCNINLLKNIKERQPNNFRLKELCGVDLFFTYFILQFKEYNDDAEETKKKRADLYNFMGEIIDNYGDELINTPMITRIKYYTMLRNDLPKYGMNIEKILGNDFVHQLEESSGKTLPWLLLID